MALMAGFVAKVEAFELKPFKDNLFSYQSILEEDSKGDFRKVDYQEMRDINQRDEIVERRVRGRYVSLSVRKYQKMERLDLARAVDLVRVGDLASARFAVIFIHGRGGDRQLGANDFSFGGNFNRLKNLAVNNQGVYFAPSVHSFDAEGVRDVAGLIAMISERAPNAPVVLSCASMGSSVCWGIARDAAITKKLQGMVILGGAADPSYLQTAAFKARLPLYFTHGSLDTVYAAEAQLRLFRSLRKQDYPARFVVFETGSHGTPIRMTDWRDCLNWIFAQ